MDDLKRIERHPAWRRHEGGGYVLKKWVWWPLAILWCFGFPSLYLSTPAIIAPDGLGQWSQGIWTLSLSTGVLTFWMLWPLARFREGPFIRFGQIFQFGLAGLIICAGTVAAMQLSLTRTLPNAAMMFFTHQFEMPANLYNVYRIRKCHRRCILASLTGRDKDRFGVTLVEKPSMATTRIILRDPPQGIYITGPRSGCKEPLAVTLHGYGNWFGWNVTSITRVDS